MPLLNLGEQPCHLLRMGGISLLGAAHPLAVALLPLLLKLMGVLRPLVGPVLHLAAMCHHALKGNVVRNDSPQVRGVSGNLSGGLYRSKARHPGGHGR